MAALAEFIAIPSPASAETCEEIVDLGGATINCVYTGASLQDKVNSDPEAVYAVFQACFSGTSGEPEPCSNPHACRANGATGTIYAVRRNGEYVGTACLTAGDSKDFTQPIGPLAAKRFKELEWPTSGLTVQPPGGQTLVNFETIFYTTNNTPTSKMVRLLGQQVEIEATPTSYSWYFGDGVVARTASAGKPYPNQDVVHTYTDLAPVKPSVDTTYTGRFRVNGGAWEDIAETVTVAGAPVGLRILEATPELVAPPGG